MSGLTEHQEDKIGEVLDALSTIRRICGDLSDLIDGADPEADGMILLAATAALAELGDLQRRAGLPWGNYREDWERVEGMDVLPTRFGGIVRSWRSSSEAWEWDAITPQITEYVCEGLIPEARPLVEVAVREMAACIGLSASKTGRKTDLRNRGIEVDRYVRSKGNGAWRYEAVTEAELEERIKKSQVQKAKIKARKKPEGFDAEEAATT